MGLANLLMTATVLLAARAPAPQADADGLVAHGVELRRQGQDAEALDLFRQAHALAPSGKTLAQMGFAEAALGRWLDAEDHLAEASRVADSFVTKNRKVVDEQLAAARSQIGTLHINGPAGAVVLVDGHQIGALPLAAPLRHARGAILVGATAPGFVAADRSVTIEGGKEQTVVLAMTPLAPPQPLVTSRALEHAGGSSDDRGRRWLVGGLAATSVVGLGTGAVLLYLDGRTNCASKTGPACPTVYKERTPAIISLSLGAASGIAAGILYWSGRETAVAVGPGSVAIVGAF